MNKQKGKRCKIFIDKLEIIIITITHKKFLKYIHWNILTPFLPPKIHILWRNFITNKVRDSFCLAASVWLDDSSSNLPLSAQNLTAATINKANTHHFLCSETAARCRAVFTSAGTRRRSLAARTGAATKGKMSQIITGALIKCSPSPPEDAAMALYVRPMVSGTWSSRKMRGISKKVSRAIRFPRNAPNVKTGYISGLATVAAGRVGWWGAERGPGKAANFIQCVPEWAPGILMHLTPIVSAAGPGFAPFLRHISASKGETERQEARTQASRVGRGGVHCSRMSPPRGFITSIRNAALCSQDGGWGAHTRSCTHRTHLRFSIRANAEMLSESRPCPLPPPLPFLKCGSFDI